MLLHMAYPAMTKRVQAAARDFETVTDRIEGIHEHIMIVKRGSVPGLKDTTKCAVSKMLFDSPNCCRIDPHFAMAITRLRRNFLPAPHQPSDMNHSSIHVQIIDMQSEQFAGSQATDPGK
jgi:hypothetical protein